MNKLSLTVEVTRLNETIYAYVPNPDEPGFAFAVETGNTVREAIINLIDLIDLTLEDD